MQKSDLFAYKLLFGTFSKLAGMHFLIFCILNRLQVAAGKKDAPLTSPSEKRGPESPESKHEAGGIRIKISPAPAQAKVNNPPKTCLKVIGKYLSVC